MLTCCNLQQKNYSKLFQFFKISYLANPWGSKDPQCKVPPPGEPRPIQNGYPQYCTYINALALLGLSAVLQLKLLDCSMYDLL